MSLKVTTASLLFGLLLGGSAVVLNAQPAEAKKGGRGGQSWGANSGFGGGSFGANNFGGRSRGFGHDHDDDDDDRGSRRFRRGSGQVGGFGRNGRGSWNNQMNGGQFGGGGRMSDFLSRNGLSGMSMRDAAANGQLASLLQSGNLSTQDQRIAERVLNRWNQRNSLSGGVNGYGGNGFGSVANGYIPGFAQGFDPNFGSSFGGGGFGGGGFGNGGFGNGGFGGGGFGNGGNGRQPNGKAWGWYRNNGMPGMSGMPPGQAKKFGY